MWLRLRSGFFHTRKGIDKVCFLVGEGLFNSFLWVEERAVFPRQVLWGG